jgi:hypothetical protein
VSTTGQLFFRINMGPDGELGAIDNTGATATPDSIYFGGGNASSPSPTATPTNETAVAVDTAAGLVFSVGIGNNGSFDAVSVHNLKTGALIETIEFGANTGSVFTDDVVQALALDPFTNTLYVGDWGLDSGTTGVAAFTYDPAPDCSRRSPTATRQRRSRRPSGPLRRRPPPAESIFSPRTTFRRTRMQSRSTSIAPTTSSTTSTTTAATTSARSARPMRSMSSTSADRRSPRPS